MSKNPLLTITMGDAAGIGSEIILKSLAAYYPQNSRPLVIGDIRIFQRAAQVVQSGLTLHPVKGPDDGNYQPGIVNMIDLGEPSPKAVPFGKISSAAGKGAVAAIRKAHEISIDYPVRALLSAPMNKESIQEAGFSYIDECAMMTELTGAPMPMMLLVSEKMRMATVSPLHISLRKACEVLTAEKIVEALKILQASLVSFGIERPIIGVAALNPHAGEGGKMGDEEKRAIIPAVEEGKKRGWELRGPFPADSFFFRASKREFDAVLTMYHDQGRIAMKSMDFGRIIIVMIGIPIPFVTVAHGTAFGKAGKGTADPNNFIQAMQFADNIQSKKGSSSNELENCLHDPRPKDLITEPGPSAH